MFLSQRDYLPRLCSSHCISFSFGANYLISWGKDREVFSEEKKPHHSPTYKHYMEVWHPLQAWHMGSSTTHHLIQGTTIREKNSRHTYAIISFDTRVKNCRPENQSFIFKWQQRPPLSSIPSHSPPFNVGSISLAAEDITPANIDFGDRGGTFDRLQPKVCQHFLCGL